MAFAVALKSLALASLALAVVVGSPTASATSTRFLVALDGLVPEGQPANLGEIVFLSSPCRTFVSAPRPNSVAAAQAVPIHLEFHFPSTIETVSVALGRFHAGYEFAGAETGVVLPTDADGDLNPDRSVFTFLVLYGGQSFEEGDRLALRVCVEQLPLLPAILFADGSSHLAIEL